MSSDHHVSLDGRRQRISRRPNPHPASVCCIFSTSRSLKTNTGTTLRGHGRMHYWLVRQMGETAYGVRGVDADFLPFGTESIISEEELLTNYAPEVAVFEDETLPAAVRQGYTTPDRDRSSASLLRDPLTLDAINCRSLFDLAIKYITSRKTPRGRNLINQLVQLKTDFRGKNQFLYNEFGIRLRKAGFLEGAIICYRRALKYTLADDHLYYNLARAYYEQGQWWDCITTLGDCFEINPALPLARDLVVLTLALSENPALRTRYDKPPVPEGVAARANILSDAVFLHEPDMQALMRERTRLKEEERQRQQLWLPGRNAVGL